jgi:hypothetical protein
MRNREKCSEMKSVVKRAGRPISGLTMNQVLRVIDRHAKGGHKTRSTNTHNQTTFSTLRRFVAAIESVPVHSMIPSEYVLWIFPLHHLLL